MEKYYVKKIDAEIRRNELRSMCLSGEIFKKLAIEEYNINKFNGYDYCNEQEFETLEQAREYFNNCDSTIRYMESSHMNYYILTQYTLVKEIIDEDGCVDEVEEIDSTVISRESVEDELNN